MTDQEITELLTNVQTIALVGASTNPARDSNQVMAFLLGKRKSVHPVNPVYAGTAIHGREVKSALSEIEGSIDLVDIFRASDQAGAVVDEAIAVGAKAVWMQLGVVDEAAAARARAAGLRVVMDRCPKKEWARLGLP